MPVRERLADAALTLFDQRGYEQTTVDDIAEQAGVGRTTFFRHYRSKEDVIFPEHARLLDAIRDRLATSTHSTALIAVSEAVRLVLMHYLEEGELARRRYKLTSRVAVLRDREIASQAQYQRLFREFISQWMRGDKQAGAESESVISLRAELMAGAVVSAHNHVLRRWLRGECEDPAAEVDEAMREVVALFSPREGSGGTTVVAFRSAEELDAVVPELRKLLGDGR
jgi:AcrR family transcriptional regulator